MLRRPNIDLAVLRSDNFLATGAMTVLESRGSVDQPYIEASTDLGNGAPGHDRIYIGNNDFAAPNHRTATIDFTSDGRAPPPSGLHSVRLDVRTTSGQDGPRSVRPITATAPSTAPSSTGDRAASTSSSCVTQPGQRRLQRPCVTPATTSRGGSWPPA